MIPFSSLSSNQIRFLLQSLNDSNFDSVFRELSQFTEYGVEGSILVLQTCLDHMNFPGSDLHNMKLKPDLLAALLRYMLKRPNFSTVLCEALGSIPINENFIGELCSVLQFSMSERIAVALALSDSEDPDMRKSGQSFCMGQIEELCGNPASADSVEQIQNIIVYLYQSEGIAKHVDSFMQMLSLMEPKEKTQFILAPLLLDDADEAKFPRNLDLFHCCSESEFDAIVAEMESETSMADIMRELGYGCTANSLHCKELLSLFLPLSEDTVARILGTIVRTHACLEDSQNSYSTFCSAIGSPITFDSSCPSSWNVEVLVESIKQLAPGTNWMLVMKHLDHEGFYFPNEAAFSLFMSIYAQACRDPFPLHTVCGSVWKNVEGQLSFLRYAVSAPPQVFSFAHSSRKLVYADTLNGRELPLGQANEAWLSIDLLEVLCQLAEMGHAS